MNFFKKEYFFTAFLLVVLLPVFPWAEELPPYQKYVGPIKPGVVITKENWGAYLPELEKLLPPSKLQWYSMGVKEGLVTMPIVENTHLPKLKGFVEATRKYAGTARVGSDNQLHDWVAGMPFPEPRNAREIAWNFYPDLSRPQPGEDLLFHAEFLLFSGPNYEKRFIWDLFNRRYRGRTDIPPLGDMPQFKEKGISFKEAIVIYEPNEVRGFSQLRIRYWDVNKEDECYAYLPAVRRVRRLTGSDLTDPLLGSDCIPEDFQVMRQKFDSRMRFRVLEHRDFMVPRNYIGWEDRPSYDYKKHGPFFQVEWEIKPLWVMEIMINNPDYAYSKRVVYIDATPFPEGFYCLYWGEEYDQNGRMWKANGFGASAYGSMGMGNLYLWMYMNCLTNHFTVMTGYPTYVKDFEETIPLKEDEAFTIKGLLRKAQ
ncbi:conserved hypothetical protein [uncultured Desulfobacterium sp.]|uniref:DUF1329 domain-containing protein n=1 Tax=uncultured Desulfobacterium sp. TaxID=201089 RepID=A0A445MSH9_9BACT|nr:conserved hypothetical protein [uncultured Desulfobacterium sp.]